MNATAPTILVGVTGCVAIYKTCDLVRMLQKEGYNVKVVMTNHATRFIDPNLFRALTRNPVGVGLFDDAPSAPIHHISLAKEADLFVIAPCTANVIAKLAHGIADDLLTTTALAVTSPLIIAPAMNNAMYANAATQDNIALLKKRGIHFVDPVVGDLACGVTAKGHLAPLSDIFQAIQYYMKRSSELIRKRILITSGPTREPIDPVRYISNRSSGKMGCALAEQALLRGAEVDIVSGPVNVSYPFNARVHTVKTAQEMKEKCDELFPLCDIALFCAAVCDIRPRNEHPEKIKKGIDDGALSNIPCCLNPDIAKSCAQNKRDDQIVIGFAAETSDVIEYAKRKLAEKNLDMVIANDVSAGNIFGKTDTTASIVTHNSCESYQSMPKSSFSSIISISSNCDVAFSIILSILACSQLFNLFVLFFLSRYTLTSS